MHEREVVHGNRERDKPLRERVGVRKHLSHPEGEMARHRTMIADLGRRGIERLSHRLAEAAISLGSRWVPNEGPSPVAHN